MRPQILRSRDDYADLTQSRYDYVVGQQTQLDSPDRLMRNEAAVPVLPGALPLSTSVPAGSVKLPPAPAPQ